MTSHEEDSLAQVRRDLLHARWCLERVVVTNSIPQIPEFEQLPFVTVQCLSDALARTINRVHYGRSVSEVFYRP